MNVAVGLRASAPKQKHPSKRHYKVVAEYLYQVELGEYHTYGIQLVTPERTDTLHDVSVCQKTAEHIVELLNRYQLPHIHLYDVVTDMLP